MEKPDQTAILIFSRYANEEAKQKRYANYLDKRSGVKLAGVLINHTLEEAKKSKLKVFTCFSDQQSGNNFGERIANAVEEIFSLGVTNLIVTGSDSPSISNQLFTDVNEKLLSHSLVLGPAKDGGVYIIGINKDAYNRKRFIQIPWLSSEVFNAFKHYASVHDLSLSIQPCGEDIDDIKTLLDWLNFYPVHSLNTYIRKILSHVRKINLPQELFFYFNNPCITRYLLRGPPCSFFSS